MAEILISGSYSEPNLRRSSRTRGGAADGEVAHGTGLGGDADLGQTDLQLEAGQVDEEVAEEGPEFPDLVEHSDWWPNEETFE